MKTINIQVPVRKCRSDQPFQKTKPNVPVIQNNEGKQPMNLYQSFYTKSETSINKNLIALKDPSTDVHESQLIPTPRTPKDPKEALRRSVIKLKSNQCHEYVAALRDVIQISRFTPELLLRAMSVIYKGITTLLKSLRPAAARTACQAANELFMNTTSVEGPEFEELVHVLLQKTSDGNKHLKKDALEALDSMIIHVPPSQSIKILLHRRIAGYNSSVRVTATKLLACVFNISGGEPEIDEVTKIRLVMGGVRCLQDERRDIKFYGALLVSMLMRHKEYERIFLERIKKSALEKIYKIMDHAPGPQVDPPSGRNSPVAGNRSGINGFPFK